MSPAQPPPATGAPEPIALRAAGVGALLVLDLLIVIGRLGLDWVSAADLWIHNWFLAVRTPLGAQLVTDFTNLGRTLPMLVIGVIATSAQFLVYRRAVVWAVMVIVPICSVGTTEGLKAVFRLARPDFAGAVAPFEESFSFPSGHTLNSTAIIGALAYLTCWLSRRLWVRVVAIIVSTAWIVAMGLSRVYLGHHWPSDVALGWSLGLTWLAALIWAHRAWLARRGATRSESPAPRVAS
jgi:Membrane-associated phospholipid phosphatase